MVLASLHLFPLAPIPILSPSTTIYLNNNNNNNNINKCAKASFKKGKLASTGNIVIDDDAEIQELDQEGVYKYLAGLGVDGIQHSKKKEKIRKEYNRRVRLILRTELNGRNKIEAINSPVVPVVQYSFGIIDWKISELKKIDTKTRKLLSMHKMLHPKADVERL